MASRSFPSISFQRIMAFVKARPGIVAGGALLAAYFLDPDEISEDDVDELPLPSFHNKLLQNQNRSNRHILPPSNLIHGVTAGCLSAKKSLDTHPTGTEGTLVTNAAHFESLYQLGPKLGTGAFAVVYKCTPKSTSSNVAAVKVFDLSRVPAKKQARIRADIHKEYTILQSLQHDRIVQVYDLFEAPTQNKVYVVMEFCQGGELFERIVAKTTYNEKEARDVIRTLLTALAFCHEDAGVVHRDLKPENLLLESETDDLHIKVADFGAACLITESDCLSHYCGTPSYTAPEILARQKYGPKVDVWSAGIIAYILLGGYPPFADNQDQLRKRHTFYFHSPEWDAVSPEAKDLISRLLHRDPQQRLSAREALAHAWFEKEKEELEDRELPAAKEGIEKFNALRKLRGAVKAIMATAKMRKLLSREE